MASGVLGRMKALGAWEMTKDTLNGFIADECLSRGASIAYFTIFSLAPILIVIIAIAGFVFGPEAARGEIFTKLRGTVGPDAAGMVQSMLQSAANRRSGTIATIVSIIMLILTATGVFSEMQSSLNLIWKADPSAHSTVTRLLKARAQSLGLVVTLGFLLLVSLAISAALTAAWHRIDRVVPDASFVLRLLNLGLSIAITTVLFGSVYKVLPDKNLEWRDVIAGSVFTALLYTVGKMAIAIYVGSSGVSSSYGAASALVVLLLWIYYSAEIFLLGAEFTKVYAHRHGSQAAAARARLAPAAAPLRTQPVPAEPRRRE